MAKDVYPVRVVVLPKRDGIRNNFILNVSDDSNGVYYLVSACLLGINCRYNSSSAYRSRLRNHLKNTSVLLICPEKLGGLPTPRSPVQIVGNKSGKTYDGKSVWMGKARLLTIEGRNVTSSFLKGCKEVRELLKRVKVKSAFLKARSPSCGYGFIYNRDSVTKKITLVKGNGVLSVLLKQRGIPIKSC